MTRIPRDISGEDLARALSTFGYVVVRQTGSHIRLVSEWKGHPHHITIPNHDQIKIGTLNNILTDVAEYVDLDKRRLIMKLFDK